MPLTPYPCPRCDRRFESRRGLDQHIRQGHHACPDCRPEAERCPHHDQDPYTEYLKVYYHQRNRRPVTLEEARVNEKGWIIGWIVNGRTADPTYDILIIDPGLVKKTETWVLNLFFGDLEKKNESQK